MKKILVTTDFSKESEYALKVAAQLARQRDSEIYLLHMLEIPYQELDAAGVYSELPEGMFFFRLAEQKFDSIASKPYLDGLTVHKIMESSNIFAGIKKTCKKHDIDFIMMGSHGATGLKEMFIGSNAEQIVRNSEVPVLVIKNEHEDFSVKEFVFASDFKNDNKETFNQACKFAEFWDAKIHLLMVNTPSNFTTTAVANERIASFIKKPSYKNYTLNIYNDETVEQGILNFSKSINADLIGISTHGRQGIAHFFNGSISEDIVNHAKRPVMTFKI